MKISMPISYAGGFEESARQVVDLEKAGLDIAWIAEAYGFGVALDYVSGVGLEAIEAHEHELVVHAMDALAEIPGVRVFGPPADRRTGIVSFELENVHPHDVAQILNWEGVAVRAGHHCTQPLMRRLNVTATARASFYLYNELDEVDALAGALVKAGALFGYVPA